MSTSRSTPGTRRARTTGASGGRLRPAWTAPAATVWWISGRPTKRNSSARRAGAGTMAGRSTSAITGAMTVDVEDYFQVAAFAERVRREDWDSYPCRVERNVHRNLGMFADHGVTATFFTLGWVAERSPGVVRRLADAGPELAGHGYEHIKVHS